MTLVVGGCQYDIGMDCVTKIRHSMRHYKKDFCNSTKNMIILYGMEIFV